MTRGETIGVGKIAAAGCCAKGAVQLSFETSV